MGLILVSSHLFNRALTGFLVGCMQRGLVSGFIYDFR